MIAQLESGDKVEPEWLQIRVEMETTVDEDRYSIIEQCQKLYKVDAEAERTLLEQYPQPQIMVRKPETADTTNDGKQGGSAEKNQRPRTARRRARKEGPERRDFSRISRGPRAVACASRQ